MKNEDFLVQNGVDLAKSLELFGDMEMYNESLGDFMSEIGNKLFKIKQFKEMADMANYAILVHSLKSDAKYFGFTKLAELAYEHELKSKENNVVYVNDNYEALIQETNRMIKVVNQYLGTENNSDTAPVVAPKAVAVASDPIALDTAIPLSHVVAADLKEKPKTILVVDDSDIIKNFIQKKFEGNYHVLMATDGAEAINIIQNTFDLSAMLLDLNMPNVDGFEVLDYMRKGDLFKHIPVAVITGNDAKEIDAKAFSYPIVDIIKKPFSESAIRSTIEKTISNKN